MSLSHSNPPTPQALTPIISPPLLPQTSSSSASSIISRQSSCRSTTSVQAVPFKNPIRGPLTVNPRAESGMVIPPLPTGAADLGMNRTGSLGAGAAGGGGSYFSGAPIMRRGSDNNDNGGNSGYPSGFTTLHPVNSNGSSSGFGAVGLGVGAPTSLWNRQATQKEENQKERERDEEELLERPEVLRNGSSTLSSKPAKVRIGDAGETVLVIRKTVADYIFGDILGEGSYSTVYQVTDRQPPHRSYALKVLDKEHIKREKKIKYVLIERDTLKMLDGHPGIVRLYWTFQDARSLYYVLELAKNGELLKWIKKFGSFSLPSARYYAAQILSAVEHMHSKNVIHRDLKPENILLDEHMRVKVTDFGTAKLLPEVPTPVLGEPPRQRSRSFVGTPEYVSPEILSEKKESSKSSDYWGFGCILFQLLAGRPPFQAKTEYLMFQKIIKLEYEFPDGFPSDARDLVERLLVLDPLDRLGGGELGITAIKSHPFFSSTDFSTIWTVPPPTIETGITEPKKEEYGEFVMPEGLDGFVSEEEESAEGGEGDEEVGGVRDGEHEQGVVASGLIVGIPKEAVTKWTGILLPSETILFASPILDRSGFLTKKRTLILTDYPRLICIKETPLKVTLKTEIFVGTKGVGGGSLIFSRADEGEGDRLFSVKTTQRTFKYEEPSGGAARWVSELREAQEKGLGLTTPAANGK